ncbi:MAG: hypothetical protein WBO10_12670 [Pyrinomonadaceae bacterium]
MRVSKAVLLFTMLVLASLATFGQTPSYTPDPATVERERQRAAAEARMRADQERAQQRLSAVSKRINPDDIYFDGIMPRYGPNLTDEDIRAISISPEDLKTYQEFLRSAKTGIVRLQNAEICPPNPIIVRASAGCANNVNGKATAYSFRAGGYRAPLFADLSFRSGKLAKSGVFVIGLLSDLGTIAIAEVGLASDGVQQLVDYRPPVRQDEIERQYSILSKGAVVSGHVYGPEVGMTIGNVYVLRSVAYKGKLEIGEKPKKIDVLENDERKDVTLVFKIIRQHEDGSIVLLWKELNRLDPPGVVLEAKNEKGAASKNEFAQ